LLTPIILATQEAEIRRIAVGDKLGKKQDFISKNTQHTHKKKAGRVPQVVEHLPPKHEAKFKPQYHQKQKNKN
jgi:hypothetical protein